MRWLWEFVRDFVRELVGSALLNLVLMPLVFIGFLAQMAAILWLGFTWYGGQPYLLTIPLTLAGGMLTFTVLLYLEVAFFRLLCPNLAERFIKAFDDWTSWWL